MKKLVIIIVALLLLGGGGFAVWKYFFKDGGPAEVQKPAEGEGQGPIFVDMEPFVIPVIREDRVVKYLSLAVKLDINGPEAKKKVDEMMPYLRDAFLTRLHAVLSRGDPNQTYDAEKLKRQLLAESERVLGPGLVRDVLIGSVAEKKATP